MSAAIPNVDEDTHLASAVASLGDRLAIDEAMRRLDERAMCFDPDPQYRAELKRRLAPNQLLGDIL